MLVDQINTVLKLYHNHGFRGFQLADSNSKAPKRSTNFSKVKSYSSDHLVGYCVTNTLAWHLSASRAAVIDWDKGKDDIIDRRVKQHYLNSMFNWVNTPSGGRHYYFKITDDELYKYKNKSVPGVDVKFYGNSYVKAYTYSHVSVFTPMPVSTKEFIEIVEDIIKEELSLRDTKLMKDKGGEELLENNISRVWETLNKIDPDIDYYLWGSICCALKAMGLEETMFHEWSVGGEKYNYAAAHNCWVTAKWFDSKDGPMRFLENLAAKSTLDEVFKSIGEDND